MLRFLGKQDPLSVHGDVEIHSGSLPNSTARLLESTNVPFMHPPVTYGLVSL